MGYDRQHLGDADRQEKLKQGERRLRDFELSDLEGVLRTPYGRRFYYRVVFEMCDLKGGSFYGEIKAGDSAAQHSARKEGIRQVGRWLDNEASEHFPELWLLAEQERLARVQADNERREQELKSAGVSHE